MTATNTRTRIMTKGLRLGYATGGTGRALDAVARSMDLKSRRSFYVYQFGWRPPSSFSGRTHAREALDLQATPAWRELVYNARRLGIWLDHRKTSEGPWAEHVHGARLGDYADAYGPKAWLDPTMYGQQREYVGGGDGLQGSARDDDPRPRYPDVRFVDDQVRTRWVALHTVQGYDQAGGHPDDKKPGTKRDAGWKWAEKNLATVEVKGHDGHTREWLVTPHMTFYRKSDFRKA